ncbi:hypothetical protein [Psychromonas sp. MME2]|uniref:hypothetical protein n=1 Tax=unclassified Psychromonas TaxID=2614957 RepID=UPI00339CBE64
MFRVLTIFCFVCASFSLQSQPYKINLSATQISQLGQLIWQNEGQQKLQHLTSWNQAEDFPSLGLGHFIWYPTKEKGPFKEQFPELLIFFRESGVKIPSWLEQTKLAPWQSRTQFYEEFEGEKLASLRLFLSEQVDLQAKFIIRRLEKAIPSIIATCNPADKTVLLHNLSSLTNSVKGTFVLLDYVNFKGEGVANNERYQGQGWGLKQVLLNMPRQYDDAIRAFSFSADEVLTRRVKNAPRDEFRWLNGWRARLYAYPQIRIE